MKRVGLPIAIGLLLGLGCKSVELKEEPLRRETGNASELIDQRIKTCLHTIDSLEDTRDVYAKRNLQVRVRELLQETDQLCQYLTRCQLRIIAAAGGNNLALILHPADTAAVPRFMLQQRQADTLREHLSAMHGILLGLVRDTTAAVQLLPPELAGPATTSGNEHALTPSFQNMPVKDAIELLDTYIYDCRACELAFLGRILKDAEKRH